MFRSGVVSSALGIALLASACSSGGGFTLASSRSTCITVAGVLGGIGGSVLTNQREPRETDERVVGAGAGIVTGAALGYLLCGEGGAVALPTAGISATPRTGEIPLRVTLTAEVPPDARIESYEWDLGDGTQAQGATIAHTFGSASSYDVKLKVVDSRGRTALATTRIDAQAPRPPEPPVSSAPPTPRRIVLRGVTFEFDSARVRTTEAETLDFAAEQLRENPAVRVTVTGHTDAVGSEDYNLELSRRRADAVIVYLESKGLARERFEAHGAGEAEPVASNETDDGRAQNRRVELDVLQ